MGIIIRQSFKTSFSMYIGALIGMVNRLFLMPKYMTLEQIGLVDLLLIFALFLSSIASSGTIGTLVKYYDAFEKKNKLPSFIGYLTKINIVGYIIIVVILIIFKDLFIDFYKEDSALVSQYYYFVVLFTLAFMLKGFLSNYSITNMRATVPSIIGDIGLKVGMTILLVLLGIKMLDFTMLVVMLSGIYLLMGLSLFGYCKYLFQLKSSFSNKDLNREERGNIYKYSGFILLAGMSGYITQFIDTFMVGGMKGLDNSGIYSIAFFIGIMIEMPKRAISSISLPIIVKHLNNEEFGEIDKLYKQSSINQGIVGAFLLVLLAVNLDDVFYLLPKEELILGKYVALIIGTTRLFDMIMGVNSEILRSSKYYHWDLVIVLSFIAVSVLCNYLLIPIFGLNGAAIASMISIILYNIVRFVLLKKFYQLNPFTWNTLKLLILILSLLGVSYWVPSITPDGKLQALFIIGIKTIVYGFAFAFVVVKLKLSNEVNSLINTLLSKVKR